MEITKRQLQENYNSSDVDFIFNSNPQLGEIGTKEEYSQYLDTIFSSSKIRDIFFHRSRSEEKFDSFDLEKVRGYGDYGGNGFYFAPLEKIKTLWKSPALKNVTNNIVSVLLDIKNPWRDPQDLKQYDTKEWNEYINTEYNGRKYMFNPWYDDKDFKNKFDAIFDYNDYNNDNDRIVTSIPTQVLVYRPEQIHILGSKKDIEKFKNFVNRNTQTQFEGMEVSKKDLENQKLINQAHKDITRIKGNDYAPDVHEIQKWINNPKKLKDDAEEITKGEIEEAKKVRTKLRKKKKADRCTRIAKSKYDVWPSAYASGAVVKCRQGKIWKGLKEGEENFGSDDINLSGHKNYTDWVIIHRNLNKPPYWSIKQSNGSKKIGKVIGYDTSILLKDVKFIVLKSEQERARSEQTKNVHGGAVGKIVDSGGNYNTNGWTLVTYNPFIDDTFIEKETGEPIYTAKEAVLKNTKEIWVKKEDESLDEKTDFSKEKEQGLHGWFARQGGKGKSKGWVDCNTCRDGKCKSCGRKEGEKRSKYPACRPTPSACKTKGKGKSWGKKNEEFPIQSLYREKENMEIKKKDIFDEDLVLKRDQSKKAIYVQSDLTDDKARSQETYKNKEALKSAGFKWDGDIKSWKTDDVNFMLAKKTIETINKKEFLIDTLEQLEEIIASSENTPEKEGLMGKIDMYINDLSNATDEAAMSSEIRRYLTFFSKFRGHSLFNTWLIYIQSGGKATKVAGFRQWEAKFYRRVKKGAKGFQIFVPIFTKSTSKDDETGEEITKENAVRFKPGYVFDISQTEPIDERGEVPEEPNWFADLEPTERSIELYKYFIELCEDMGIQISKSGSERGEKGYSAGNKINISSAREGAGEVSTLVHEIAHELMHWKKSSIYFQDKTDAKLRELQAESVSYVVLKHYELPTEHHPTYLALWKANKEKIKENVKVITDVAKFIISEIDKIEKRNQKNEVINEQVFKDVKNIFKRFMK